MEIFKAALNEYYMTMEQVTLCNVKKVTHSDEPTENYHLVLHFPSGILSNLCVFLAHCSAFTAHKLYCFTSLSSTLFPAGIKL